MPIGSHWSQVETVDNAPDLKPDDIESQQFESVQRGYDPAAVVSFLRDVARGYRRALAEAADARHELETRQPVVERVEVVREVPVPRESSPADPYEAMSEEVATVLRAAYESAAEVRANAEREREESFAELRRRIEEQERILEEERNRADVEIRARRQRLEEDAATIIADARREAERIRCESDEHVARVRAEHDELALRLSAARSLLSQLLGEVRDVATLADTPAA